jgi:hypothetical protein
MKWSYACPKCGAMLNPAESIILIGVLDDRRTLMAFHPEPGNYEIHVPPHTHVVPGSRSDFFCPVCQGNLVATENENLCALELTEGAARRRVLFSRVAGEHATLVVADRQVTGYGEHAPPYVQHLLEHK